MLGSEESLRVLRDRFGTFSIAVMGLFAIIFLRLVYLQIIRGSEFKQYSEDNRLRQEKIPSPRGIVFDRDGNILVDNVPAFDVSITPQFLQNKKETLKKLSNIIVMPVAEIEAFLDKNKSLPSFTPRIVKRDVTRDVVALISHRKLDLPGIDVEVRIKRLARSDEVGAQTLGFVGEISREEIQKFKTQGLTDYQSGDIIGKDGVESQMEMFLRGEDGKKFVEVDARGRRKNVSPLGKSLRVAYPEVEAKPGNNLYLTLDQELQLVADKAFQDKIGAAVAMDVNSGALLVMLSRPSFNPTILGTGVDREYLKVLSENEFHPFGNKVLQDHEPPGSTFKIVTAIAGLEEGVVTPDTRFHCVGRMRYGGRFIHCHKKEGHGEVSLHRAIVKSCNIYFYNVALRLGSVDLIAKYAKALGLGELSGVELSREIPGLIPTSQWKQERFGEPWQEGETLSVAIGQGFTLVTPIQQARLYGAVANGGFLLTPYLVKEIRSPIDGRLIRPEPEPVRRQIAIRPETLERVRKALVGVVNEEGGTMYLHRLKDITIAGKTGTSQVKRLTSDTIYEKCEGLPFKERRHAWFVGYAPSEKPEVVVAVLAEHACHGSSGAGPIAAAIFKAYFEKKQRENKGPIQPTMGPWEHLEYKMQHALVRAGMW